MLLFSLFLTGLFAGTIDAIAGGGGLISVPVLLSIGMPPQLAFGTNKLQAVLGTFSAVRRYHRHGLISLNLVYTGIVSGFIGAVTGAVSIQMISSTFLQTIIPILLLLILVYSILSPKLGAEDKPARMQEGRFYSLFGFILGFYDGFFGPGTGSFWVFLITFFLGYNLVKATAYTKVFNFNSSFIAVICFALGGNIDYRIALCMAAGSLLGGKIGASLAIKKGAVLIRPLFLLVVTSTISLLFYKNYAQNFSIERFIHQYGVMPIVMSGAILLSVAFMFFFGRKRNEIRH